MDRTTKRQLRLLWSRWATLRVLVWANLSVVVLLLLGQGLIDLFAPAPLHLEGMLSFRPHLVESLRTPWRLLTYMWVNTSLSSLVSIGILWIVGRRLECTPLAGHIVPIYLLGGVAGALVYMLVSSLLLPLLGISVESLPLVGASASVMALLVVLALLPNVPPLIFPRLDLCLSMRTLLWIVISVDLLSLGFDGNWGGHLAHWGGALLGWIYLRIWSQYTERMNREIQRRAELVNKVRYSGYKSLSPEEVSDLSRLSQ